MVKINFKLIIFWILNIFLLTGCSFDPVKMPLVHQYTLSVVNTKQYSKTSPNKTILVTLPTAAPAFQSKNMWYSKEPYQIQSFSYNEWVAAPNNMLLPLLVESLTSSHYFKAVVSPPYSGISYYRLDTQILDFRQYFFDKNSEFRFVLHATLVNENTHNVIFSRDFSAMIKAAANPESGVIAANQAVQQVLNQLVSVISKLRNYVPLQ